MTTTEAKTIVQADLLPPARPFALEFLGKLRHHPLGLLGFIGVVALLLVALFADALAPYAPNTQDYGVLGDPTLSHPFGTDHLGRDVLSRVIVATRYELRIALVAVFGGAALATMLGMISGYIGGKVDSLLQRLVDSWLAFPPFILLIIISSIGNSSITALTIALIIGTIPWMSRVVRGSVLSEKNNAYVEAARVIGASEIRIMGRHVLPQIIAPMIVIITIAIPAVALLGASLSFLGFGVQPPTPTWGADLREARNVMEYHYWPTVFPGMAISLTVLSWNMFGDSVRDILDPRLRGAGTMR